MKILTAITKFPVDLLNLKLALPFEIQEVTLAIPYSVQGEFAKQTNFSPEEVPEISFYLDRAVALNVDKWECHPKQDKIIVKHLLDTIDNFEQQVHDVCLADYKKQLYVDKGIRYD